MKNLKSLFIAVVLICTAHSLTAQEQTKKTPEERAKLQTDRMTKQLVLTADQQSKVAELNLGIAKKNESIRNNVNMTAEQKKESINGNIQAQNDVLKTILTLEQFEKHKKSQEIRKERIEINRVKKEEEINKSKPNLNTEEEL